MLTSNLDIESSHLASLLRRVLADVEHHMRAELDGSPDAPHEDDVCVYELYNLRDGDLLIVDSPHAGGIKYLGSLDEVRAATEEILYIAETHYPEESIDFSFPLMERTREQLKGETDTEAGEQ